MIHAQIQCLSDFSCAWVPFTPIIGVVHFSSCCCDLSFYDWHECTCDERTWHYKTFLAHLHCQWHLGVGNKVILHCKNIRKTWHGIAYIVWAFLRLSQDLVNHLELNWTVITWVTNTFYNLCMYSNGNVLKTMHTTKYITHADTGTAIFFLEQPCTYFNWSNWKFVSHTYCRILCNPDNDSTIQASPWQSTFFHSWCLVRSWPFAGTGIFLAGLFTFLSRLPTVNWLRASARNWLISIIRTTKKSKQISFLHCLSWHYAELQNVVSPACRSMAGN